MRKAFRLGLVLLMLLGAGGSAWALEEFRTVVLQNATGATGNGTAIDTPNYTSIALQVVISNTATVTFEGTVDGTNYVSAVCTSTASTSATLVTTATSSGMYQCPVAGFAKFRARVSAWTSGTVTVTARVTTAVLGKKGGGAGGSGLTSLNSQTGSTQTFTDDTNVTIVSGADAHVITWAGVLAVARGGTGLSSYTAGDLIYATGATTLAKFAKCANGELITWSAGSMVCGTVDTSATTFTFTNKTIDCEATGNVCTIPKRIWLPAAGCNNATAGTIWDLPTSNPAVAACVTGTNTQKGVLEFADSASLSAQTTYLLPATWTGTVDARIKWVTAATSGNIVWQLATICVADAETDDPAFNTASTVTDAAKGTTLQTNDAAITTVTVTGCAAGELMHIKILRDSAHASDTLAATARLIGIELVIREAM